MKGCLECSAIMFAGIRKCRGTWYITLKTELSVEKSIVFEGGMVIAIGFSDMIFFNVYTSLF